MWEDRIAWFQIVENLKKKYRDKLIRIHVIMIVTTIENVKKDADKSIVLIYTAVIYCLCFTMQTHVPVSAHLMLSVSYKHKT